MALASAALVALPFAGGAFADSGQPQPVPTVTPGVKITPTTKPTAPVKTGRPTATDESTPPKRSASQERETTASTLFLKESAEPARAPDRPLPVAGPTTRARRHAVPAHLIRRGVEPRLTGHINAGPNVGRTPGEIVEVIMHCVPYAGFPRAINASNVAKKVFEQRGVA